jgi:hypothetical protein
MQAVDQAVTGWVSVKNHELKDFMMASTKRSMLIGYDLISLIGLDECEKRLNSKGIFIREATAKIVDEQHKTCYGTTYQGVLNAEMLDYSTNNATYINSLITLAGYLYNYIPMTSKENEALHWFWLGYRDLLRDGRRKTTAARLLEEVKRICRSFGAEVVPIAITIKE